MGWRRTFVALGQPNYRLWFIGQLFSLLGTWMQSTALGYLVFELTHSSAYLGYVAFAAGAPTWIFMLWAGVIADRVPRRSMLIVSQVALMLCAILLAVLVFSGMIRPWQLVVVAAVLGTANAFDAPVRQAFVNELVDRQDLGNAIALNALMFNAAVVIGPAVGGVVYAAFGPGWCFTGNAVSFLGVIGALAAMRLRAPPPAAPRVSALADLRQGLVYVARHKSIRVIMILVAAVTMLGFAYVSLLPAFAVKILHGDARANGLLQTARGVGALSGALYIASLGRQRRSGRLLALGSLLMPIALAAFATARTLPLAFGALVVVGVGLTFFFNNANALVQTLSDDGLRGRTTSIYSLMMFGLLPFGSLGMGTVAERIGEPWTVGLSAAILLAFAVAIQLMHPALRKIE
ncbi:MAG: MFS transporter [Deltaproteobacteria bacterium]|nr:MFS transporter [Deltaproteobacteria bacterium]